MALFPCHECKKSVSKNARSCPGCRAPFPAKQNLKGSGFEWKSQKTLYGFPLIYIAFDRDEKEKLRITKGIIAIGQLAITSKEKIFVKKMLLISNR